MTQSEIFQNMTKGEWKVGTNLLGESVIYADNDFDKRVAQSRIDMIYGIEAIANIEAIVLMKRETIGKGINPESVEKMKGVCDILNEEEPDEDGFVKIQASIVKEALNASKLITP